MSVRRPLPTALAAAVAALGCLLLSACGGASHAATSATDLSSVTLRFAATGWKVDAAALQVAGLANTPYKVDWSVFSGGDQEVTALRGGAIDVAETSEIPPVFGAAAGTPNFKVAAVWRANTLLQEVVAGKNSGISSIAQLKGHKVGYVRATTAQYFLDRLLEQAGLSWSDITAVPLSPGQGVAALSGGSIDAFASYGNSIITLHQQGARTIGSGADILSGNFPVLASDETLANAASRAALADLLARLNRAYAYVRAGHEQQFAQLTAAGTHEPEAEALAQIQAQQAQRPSQVQAVTSAETASEQEVADTFAALKVLPKAVQVSAFWSTALNSDLTKASKS